MKLILIMSFACSLIHAEETITQKDRFYDPALKDYVRVCEQDGNKLTIKRMCSKFEEGFTRSRNEIYKEIDAYKSLKKGDTVMVKVRKNDVDSWILAEVSFLYENGSISTMEFYNKRFGFNTGTTNRTYRYDNLTISADSKKDSEVSEMCLISDYVIKYNYDNSREFELKKGEAVKVSHTFPNGYSSITLKNHTWDDFQGYGLNNQLPIESSKLVACENESINNDSRNSKSTENNTEKMVDKSSVSK